MHIDKYIDQKANLIEKLNWKRSMKKRRTLFMLLLSSFALSLHISIEYTIHLYKVNYNCLLYGQIFEMRRVFVSRNRISCCWYLISEYFLVIASTYHLWKYLRYNSYFQWVTILQQTEISLKSVVVIVIQYNEHD